MKPQKRAGWWVAGILLAAGAIAQAPKLAPGWPLYLLYDGRGNVGIGYQADPVAAAPKPLRLCSKVEVAGRPPGTIRVFVQAVGAVDYAGCPDGQEPSVECDGGRPAPVITTPPGGIYYRPGLASTGRLDLEVTPSTPTPCRVARL